MPAPKLIEDGTAGGYLNALIDTLYQLWAEDFCTIEAGGDREAKREREKGEGEGERRNSCKFKNPFRSTK